MTEHEDDLFALPSLRGEVDTLFNRILGPGRIPTLSLEKWSPRLDLREEDDRYVIEMDLPGVRREDIDIEVRDHVLSVNGRREIVRRREGSGFSHCERFSGSFRRTFPLPGEVASDRITATLREGILHLDLPKKGRS